MRSFQTNARNRSLTTGTFNRVVKDRIAFRLSGANSVQANPLQERIRLSSKPYKHTVLRKTLSTQVLHRISTRFPQRGIPGGGEESEPQGLKPHGMAALAARLNSCPSQSNYVVETDCALRSRQDCAIDRDPGSCSLGSAQRYGLPLRIAPEFGARFFSHASTEDRKLRKELAFGGPCLEGTLQKPTLVSESSPVAGAI